MADRDDDTTQARIRTALQTLLLILTLSLAAGCGGDDASGSDAPQGADSTRTGKAADAGSQGEDYRPPDNFCSLVTLAEISEAVGEPMKLDQKGSTATGYVCEFQPVDRLSLRYLFTSRAEVNEVSGQPFKGSRPVPEVAPDAETGRNFVGDPNVRWKKSNVCMFVSSQGVDDPNAKIKIATPLAKSVP